MPYNINKTDQSSLTQLPDKSTQTFGGVTLFGRGLTEYGELLNENFVRLLENFNRGQPPENALIGQLWYDSSTKSIKVKVENVLGTAQDWKNVSTVAHSATAPTSPVPVTGDMWYDTTAQKLKLYTGVQWQEIGPYTAPEINTKVSADTNNGNSILIFSVAGIIVAIFSNTEFTPSPSILGFPKIYPGLNLRTSNLPGGLSTSSILLNDSGVFPTATLAKDLGSNSLKFNDVYAANFNGNATSATISTTSTQTDNLKIAASAFNSFHYVNFTLTNTGYSPVNVDTGLTYNPSSNILEVSNSVKTSVLESTVSTGTAPIKVASTTKVNNLVAEKAGQWETKRTVTFATGDVTGSFEIDGSANVNNVALSVNQSLFANNQNVNNAINAALPPGSIILWYGSKLSIPAGWVLCDGSNNTPDLRNRFVVGAGFDLNNIASANIEGVGKQTGGSAHSTVVTHNHTVTDFGHTHSPMKMTSGNWLGTPEAVAITKDNFDYNAGDRSPDGNVDGSRVVTGYDRNTVPIVMSQNQTGISVNNSGSSGEYKNIPPYYALCYIMRAFPNP